MDKKLHYEIIDDDKDPEKSGNGEKELALGGIEPQRDAYAELCAAVGRITRMRFKLKPDTSPSRMGIGLALGLTVAAGGFLSVFIKNQIAIYVICAIVLVAVITAVVAMCVLAKKQNGAHYCCFVRDGDDVRCLSVTDDRAVLFVNGVAYVVDGDDVITLDRNGFVTYLEGECTGLYAIMCTDRSSVSFTDDGAHYVKNPTGGGHTVYIEDGKIAGITSEQPYETNDVDGKTGERIIKTRLFRKTDPQEDFLWEVPEFVKTALAARGVEI